MHGSWSGSALGDDYRSRLYLRQPCGIIYITTPFVISFSTWQVPRSKDAAELHDVNTALGRKEATGGFSGRKTTLNQRGDSPLSDFVFSSDGFSLSHVCVYACVRACVRACARARARVCVCVRACVRACIRVCVCVYVF